MRLLFLGGTRFLGRHLVDAALGRGHVVTTFSRGYTPTHEHPQVVPLGGNRDPNIEPGLAALGVGTWDAVIDTSGYVPRIVEASAQLLDDRVGRYLFVSSLSVYAKPDRPGLDERAPVDELADPHSENLARDYGALKALCEAVVNRYYSTRATLVRPGLIVGPYDATDRFGYWVARFLAPALLGDRASRAVVPAPASRPIQFIDARDLAQWMISLVEGDRHGTFNAASPASLWNVGDLVAALAAASVNGPRPVWVEDAVLAAHRVVPWMELPLWLPESEPDHAGFMEFDCSRASASGLSTRPLAQTIDDTAAWLRGRDNAGAWQHVLGADKERAILEAVGEPDGTDGTP